MFESSTFDVVKDHMEILIEEIPNISLSIKEGWWSGSKFLLKNLNDKTNKKCLFLKIDKIDDNKSKDNSIESFSKFISIRYEFDKSISDYISRIKRYCDSIDENVLFEIKQSNNTYNVYAIFNTVLGSLDPGKVKENNAREEFKNTYREIHKILLNGYIKDKLLIKPKSSRSISTQKLDYHGTLRCTLTIKEELARPGRLPSNIIYWYYTDIFNKDKRFRKSRMGENYWNFKFNNNEYLVYIFNGNSVEISIRLIDLINNN